MPLSFCVVQRGDELPYVKVQEWPHEEKLPETVTKKGAWAELATYNQLRRKYENSNQ
jgi:hypothetical protein